MFKGGWHKDFPFNALHSFSHFGVQIETLIDFFTYQMVFNTIQTNPLKIIKTHAPFSVIAHPSFKEIRALLVET